LHVVKYLARIVQI